MKRTLYITPAFDKRSTVPSKNYGIHCCDLRAVVSDERGAVQFLMFTGWFLPAVREELAQSGRSPMPYPMAADLGYHSPTPRYEGQEPMGPCEFLDGKPCYYDGSGLNAQEPMELLISEGLEALWLYLEKYHLETFPTP